MATISWLPQVETPRPQDVAAVSGSTWLYVPSTLVYCRLVDGCQVSKALLDAVGRRLFGTSYVPGMDQPTVARMLDLIADGVDLDRVEPQARQEDIGYDFTLRERRVKRRDGFVFSMDFPTQIVRATREDYVGLYPAD